ncbi:MAG: hypothetical protein JWN86_1781 [Planctomycetota bacterium]|nr:hypothetical protein [Planctomycetota bacterium]
MKNTKQHKGKALSAQRLNDEGKKLAWLEGMSVESPLELIEDASGPLIGIEDDGVYWIKLGSETTPPYSYTEQVRSGSTWVNGDCTGTKAYEVNGSHNLNGQIVKSYPGPTPGERLFQLHGSPCDTSLTIRAAHHSGPVFASASVAVNSVNTTFGAGASYATGTTDASGLYTLTGIPMELDYSAQFAATSSQYLSASHASSLTLGQDATTTNNHTGFFDMWVKPTDLTSATTKDDDQFILTSPTPVLDQSSFVITAGSLAAATSDTTAWNGSYQVANITTPKFAGYWAFTSLATGKRYRAAISLPTTGGTSGVVYKVYDGTTSGTLLGSFTINQTTAVKDLTLNDGTHDVGFHVLGAFTITTGTMTVAVDTSGAAAGTTIDACYIDYMDHEIDDPTYPSYAYDGDYAFANQTMTGYIAFTALPSATYRAMFTLPSSRWRVNNPPNTAVTYKVYDGTTSGTLLDTQVINQRTVNLAPFLNDTLVYVTLGDYAISSGTMTIQVSGGVNTFVDSFRVQGVNAIQGILWKDLEYRLYATGPDVTFGFYDGSTWHDTSVRNILGNNVWSDVRVDWTKHRTPTPTNTTITLSVNNASSTYTSTNSFNYGSADMTVGRWDTSYWTGLIDELVIGNDGTFLYNGNQQIPSPLSGHPNIWDCADVLKTSWGVKHWFEMLETTGSTRTDSYGSLTLTDHNGVVRATGVQDPRKTRYFDVVVSYAGRASSKDRVRVDSCSAQSYGFKLGPNLIDKFFTLTQPIESDYCYGPGPLSKTGGYVYKGLVDFDVYAGTDTGNARYLHMWQSACLCTTITYSGYTPINAASEPNFLIQYSGGGSGSQYACLTCYLVTTTFQPGDITNYHRTDTRYYLGGTYGTRTRWWTQVNPGFPVDFFGQPWATACGALQAAPFDLYTLLSNGSAFIYGLVSNSDTPFLQLWRSSNFMNTIYLTE